MLEFRIIGKKTVLVECGAAGEGVLYYDKERGLWTFEDQFNRPYISSELRQIADMLDKLGYGPLEDKT